MTDESPTELLESLDEDLESPDSGLPSESPAAESPADGIPDGLPAELTLEGLLAMSPVVHGMSRVCWVGGILAQNPHQMAFQMGYQLN